MLPIDGPTRRALFLSVATDTGRATMVGTNAIAVANANPRSTILRRILRPFSLCVVGSRTACVA